MPARDCKTLALLFCRGVDTLRLVFLFSVWPPRSPVSDTFSGITMKRTTLTALALLFVACAVSAQDDTEILRQKTAARIDHLIEGARGIVGFAAIDLATGEWMGTNQDMVFPQASAIKIPILIEVHRQAEEGRISLSNRLMVRAKDKVGGSGVVQYFAEESSELSVRDLSILMITLSDNTATNMLIELVGMDRVNATLESYGLRKTALHRMMMDTRASAEDRENTSTPAEAARILAFLHQGTALSAQASEEIIRVLSLAKGGSFAAVFPDSVRVAWKPGGIPGVQTVWALVRLPERPFAFTVMEKFDSTGEAGEIQREIARILFDYYWRLGNASRYGTFVDPARMTK